MPLQQHESAASSFPRDLQDFFSKLHALWQKQPSRLCLGLDPDLERLPTCFAKKKRDLFSFCCAIVDATAQYVCAFKIQIAYFAAQAAEQELADLVAYIKRCHSAIPIILDAKRADICATAKQYALEGFARYGADAMTVNPYLGFDTIQPYLDWPGKGVIVLCRTSNQGSHDLQLQPLRNGKLLYQMVVDFCIEQRKAGQKIAIVMGARDLEAIQYVRKMAGDILLLIPGIGAQGGDLNLTVNAARHVKGQHPMLINISRAILYTSAEHNFAAVAAQCARGWRDRINVILGF